MTFDWPSEPKVPATYYWDYDGERLSFEVWGEDMRPERYNFYAEHTFYLVEDPVKVMVALFDAAPGQRVEFTGAFVSADEATDAITDRRDVLFRVAAMDIVAGQPITPDMLEPSSNPIRASSIACEAGASPPQSSSRRVRGNGAVGGAVHPCVSSTIWFRAPMGSSDLALR